MRKFLSKLHNQILIALILGVIFGSIFNISKTSLIIAYDKNGEVKSQKVKEWSEVIFQIPLVGTGKDTTFSQVKFYKGQQVEILNQAKQLLAAEKEFSLTFRNFISGDLKIKEQSFVNPVSVTKEGSIATSLKWVGDIFIRLLNMIAVPLVLASLTIGAASLGDIKKFARIGGKTISFFLVTTTFAISIGLILANIIQPGHRMDETTKLGLLSAYNQDAASKTIVAQDYDFVREIVNLVPKNPISAMANSEMLQIVFFALMLGLTLTLVNKEKSGPVLRFFDGLSETMIKMVDIIMYIAPIGVFGLISAVISEFGFSILQTLFWYAFTVLLGLSLQTFGVYAIIIKFFTKLKVKDFYKGIRRAQTIGFSTSSSAATLPVNMECCQENLGISKSITSFVLPLGATINMDGTALYQGVAAVFIAQVFGMDLTLFQQVTIVLTAVLASIGTAPVPGVGIIMLVIILKSVGIPQEGIALILGIDRILDMCRTVTNVSGDASITAAVASSEREILIPDLKNA